MFAFLLAFVLTLCSVEGLQQIYVPALSVSGSGSPIYAIPSISYNTLSISATMVCHTGGFGHLGLDVFVDGNYTTTAALYFNVADMHQTLPTITLYDVAGCGIKLAIATPSSLAKLFPSSSEKCLNPGFDFNDSISLMFN